MPVKGCSRGEFYMTVMLTVGTADMEILSHSLLQCTAQTVCEFKFWNWLPETVIFAA